MSNPPEQFSKNEAPLEEAVDLLVDVDLEDELGRESSGLVGLKLKPSPSQGWWTGESPQRSWPRLIGGSFLAEKQ